MAQFPRLSNREWDVLELLLQGKSNKLIASSLGISARTVEFHLKNIYAKFQVSSRIELILKLGSTTGGFEIAKLGHSTVAGKGEIAENRDKFNSRMGWTKSFRDTVSIIGKELEVKNLLNSKHILVGTITSLVTGFLWLLALSSKLLPNHIKIFIVPMIFIWLIIGFSVGLIGKRNGGTLIKVGFSALLGTGLSPLTIIPLMFVVALPVGYFAERLGIIDPSTMSSDVAYIITTIVMATIWLIVGCAIGIVSISSMKKPESPIIQPYVTDNGL